MLKDADKKPGVHPVSYTNLDVYKRQQQGLSNMEAITIFKRFMYSTGDQNVNYSLGVKSAEIDGLIDQADAEIDLVKRQEAYDKLQEISVETQPVLPLYNEKTLMVYNKTVSYTHLDVYKRQLVNRCPGIDTAGGAVLAE